MCNTGDVEIHVDSGVIKPPLESTRLFVVVKRDQKVYAEVNFAGDEVYASEELNTECVSDGASGQSCGLTDHYLDWVHRNDNFDVILVEALDVGRNLEAYRTKDVDVGLAITGCILFIGRIVT